MPVSKLSTEMVWFGWLRDLIECLRLRSTRLAASLVKQIYTN